MSRLNFFSFFNLQLNFTDESLKMKTILFPVFFKNKASFFEGTVRFSFSQFLGNPDNTVRCTQAHLEDLR